ncbi:YdcF family protein [Mesorhizobium sp. RMAD-H1]|uniref:YdcF family protein n=1 Tax=Mesorhizobium sp. RMAD-H1 TaxID=2587065 RepID=UPI0017D49555|nr:YdcF family protein [Mesorhizobium sp. RMAD-H1]MBB2972593.1 uncharacterized SAM-binding protein YcdF (DUF218 family) [Mesorhizobium sp. RMAD-H1]
METHFATAVEESPPDQYEEDRAPVPQPSAKRRRLLTHIMTRLFARLRKFFQPVTVLLIVLVLGFAVGFLAFCEKVINMQEPATVPVADGIIVLTGGQARIETAINLLKEKHGKRLLISGVHPSTKRQALQRVTHADAALFNCCIDIDRSALDTVGNATESAKWIKAHDYRRVIVVTNNYHIPRSMAELSRAMPDVEFIPYPVVRTDLNQDSWIKQGDALRVLMTEYVKYLRSMARAAIFPSSTAENAGSFGK